MELTLIDSSKAENGRVAGTRMNLSTNESIPTRYSLLSRLQDWGDQESWKDFFDTYWRLIYAVALKSGLTETEAQEVVQETVICVAKDIAKFKRQRQLGTFKGWLHQLTRWRIADQMRKRGPQQPPLAGKGAGGALDIPEQIPEELEPLLGPTTPELETLWNEEWQRNLLDTALTRVKRLVREEHYQIFDLYVLKEWPPSKVARVLRVNLAAVYLAKHRVSAVLKKELRALEKEI